MTVIARSRRRRGNLWPHIVGKVAASLALLAMTARAEQVLLVPAPKEQNTGAQRSYPQQSLAFYNRGSLIAKLSIEQMAERIKPIELTVLDPYSLTDEVYTGFPLESLFYAVYDQEWRKSDNEVIFRLSNNTQAYLPGSKVFRYASYLAFERRGTTGFTVPNERKNNQLMDVSPFYLVWDNFREPNLKDLGTKDWNTNIVGIELMPFNDRYPKTVPPPKSSQAVRNGFAAFRKYCAFCHTMNGDGASGSHELNYPVSVTEYLSDRWLRKWITNPASIQFNTTMPPLDKRDPRSAAVLNEVIAYLKAMARHKKKPR